MTLETWTFSKNHNSTKIPSSEGVSYDIKFKENTSITNPTFILNFDVTPEFNYCRYMFWYYYVEDVVFVTNKIYEIHCSIDVLASYRNDILGSTQFIKRSASDYNVHLIDNEITPTTLQTVTDTYTESDMLKGGTYIMRVLSRSTVASIDGIPTYILTNDQLKDILTAVYDPLMSVNDIWTAIRILCSSPDNNIIDVLWVPSNIVGGAAEEVFVGALGTNVTCQALVSNGGHEHGRLHAPEPAFGDFRDFDSRFTQFTLCIPCVGVVPLNPADVYAGIGVSINLEYITGVLTYHLYNVQTNAVLAKYKTNVGANVQIGGNVGAGKNNNLAGVASSLLSDVVVGNYNAIGSVGSRIEIETDRTFRMTRRLFGSAQSPLYNKGKPLNEYRQINALQGYCECREPIVSTTAYGKEKDMILNYMNNGFIIE